MVIDAVSSRQPLVHQLPTAFAIHAAHGYRIDRNRLVLKELFKSVQQTGDGQKGGRVMGLLHVVQKEFGVLIPLFGGAVELVFCLAGVLLDILPFEV